MGSVKAAARNQLEKSVNHLLFSNDFTLVFYFLQFSNYFFPSFLFLFLSTWLFILFLSFSKITSVFEQSSQVAIVKHFAWLTTPSTSNFRGKVFCFVCWKIIGKMFWKVTKKNYECDPEGKINLPEALLEVW